MKLLRRVAATRWDGSVQVHIMLLASAAHNSLTVQTGLQSDLVLMHAII